MSFDWQIFGWLAAICFGLCGLPQAIKSFQDKHSDGVSWGLIILWSLGEVFGFIYILPRRDIPLLTNYVVNTVFLAVILYYKLKGKKHD